MGRKIPAKKHRGVKDPLVQQARRLQSLKKKINAPPKDPDEQPVPQSLMRLFSFQDKDKNTKRKKKQNKNGPITDRTRESNIGKNPVARLKKLPGESGRGFSLRINSAMRALQEPAEQQGYPEDTEGEDLKGVRIAAQRKRRQRRKANDCEPEREPRERRVARRRTERQARAAEEAAWRRRTAAEYEHVPFGDVAHAPPTLPAPRHAPAAQPARRGLLLAALLGGAGADAGAGANADAERRERARLDAVAAYRNLKKERRLQQLTERNTANAANR